MFSFNLWMVLHDGVIARSAVRSTCLKCNDFRLSSFLCAYYVWLALHSYIILYCII